MWSCPNQEHNLAGLHPCQFSPSISLTFSWKKFLYPHIPWTLNIETTDQGRAWKQHCYPSSMSSPGQRETKLFLCTKQSASTWPCIDLSFQPIAGSIPASAVDSPMPEQEPPAHNSPCYSQEELRGQSTHSTGALSCHGWVDFSPQFSLPPVPAVSHTWGDTLGTCHAQSINMLLMFILIDLFLFNTDVLNPSVSVFLFYIMDVKISLISKNSFPI